MCDNIEVFRVLKVPIKIYIKKLRLKNNRNIFLKFSMSVTCPSFIFIIISHI